MKKIRQNCNVMGHLRSAHYELTLTDEEYKEYQSMSKDEQEGWIKDGDFYLDSYSVDWRNELEGEPTISDYDEKQ